MSLTGNVDPITESLMTVEEVVKRFRVSVDAVHRWMVCGVRGGVQLDAIRIGRRLYTSEDAVRRFAAKLSTGSDGTDEPRTPRRRPLPGRRLSRAETNRELDRLGL